MAVPLALAPALQGLTAATQAATQAIGAGISIYQDIGRSVINANTAVVKGLTGLNFSLQSMGAAFTGGIEAAKSIQGQASMLGMSLASVGQMFSENIRDLPGSLARNMESALMLYGAGIRGNTAAAVELAAAIRVGGGDQRAFVNELMKAFKARAMDQIQFADFVDSIRDASISNNINMQQLASTMANFTAQTEELRLFLDPEKMATLDSAITGLAAEAGFGGDALKSFFAKILVPDWDNLTKSLMVGMEGFRETLKSGADDETKKAAAIAMLEAVQDFADKLTAGGMSDEAKKALLEGLDLYDLALDAQTAIAGLMQNNLDTPGAKEKFAQTIARFQEDIDKPLEMLGMDLAEVMEKLAPEAAKALGGLMGDVAGGIRDFAAGIKEGELQELLDRMIETWRTLIRVSQDLVVALGFGKVNDASGKLIGAYKFGTNIFYEMTTSLMGMLSFLIDAFAIIADALGLFVFDDEQEAKLEKSVAGMEAFSDQIEVARATMIGNVEGEAVQREFIRQNMESNRLLQEMLEAMNAVRDNTEAENAKVKSSGGATEGEDTDSGSGGK